MFSRRIKFYWQKPHTKSSRNPSIKLETLIEILKSLGLAAGGGLSGWYFTRRQYSATAASIEADATAKMQANYRVFVEDANAKFEEMKAEISKLHSELKQLSSELEKCKNRYLNAN